MRIRNYIQRITGHVIRITLMPTYGTPSYLFAEEVGLPITIVRGEKENIISFRKRVNNTKLKIRSDLIKKLGDSHTGIWEKDHLTKVRQIRHDYVLLN